MMILTASATWTTFTATMVVGLLWWSVAVAMRAWWRASQTEARRRFYALTQDHRPLLSASSGVSILCSDPENEERVADWVATEFPACEVVVVIDGTERPELLARLMRHYRMIRVVWTADGADAEFPATGVAGLYRSRKRWGRRLVLVDRRRRETEERCVSDWDAAASVATYEWLLPLRGDVELLPDALWRLTGCAGEEGLGVGCVACVACVESRGGEAVRMMRRSAVCEAGGFARSACPPKRGATENRRVVLRERLACSERSRRRERVLRHATRIAVGALTAGMMACVVADCPQTATVLLASVIFLLSCEF